MIKIPSCGGASGSINAMLGNSTSTDLDLRYLSFALNVRVGERGVTDVLDILVIVMED